MPILPHASSIDRWLLQQVFKAIGPAPIRLVLNSGAGVNPPGVSPVATVRIRDRRTLAELALDPEIGFGEAYSEGRIHVDGDLVRALEATYDTMANAPSIRWHARLWSKWMKLLQSNSLRGSRDNVHHHYDLGNEFYKLWLDSDLVYTCAYFPTPSATLEQAQTAKMDHICRKLQLQPGETVVEAGCGWGALALHMARNYGVFVKAFNISHEQIVHARRGAVEGGLNDRVEFIEDDYRNITGKFDVFASVGMLEHVGADHYRDFGKVIHRTIGDSGRGLIHFIGRSYKADLSRWIRKRIFPGGYVPTLREVMSIFEPWSYSVLDVENLRPHYAKTLEHWLDRFEKAGQQVSAMYDAWFQRAWRLYLAGSIAGFRCGTLELFQVVFAGSARREIPWTLAALYSGEPLTEEAPTEKKKKWIHAMS